MSTGILALTKNALYSALLLKERLSGKGEEIFLYAPKKLAPYASDKKIDFYEDTFSDKATSVYQSHERLIFIMAAGIVVRSIAHLLKDKRMDPAVVVMDERLQFAVSLVGGHVAGANELARLISESIGCQAVITTATDVNGAGALDLIARDLNAYRDDQRQLYKAVNLALAQQEKVFLSRDEYARQEKLDLRGFTLLDERDPLHKEAFLREHPESLRVHIGILPPEEPIENIEIIIPKKLILGMGCKKNTPYRLIAEVFEEFMQSHRFFEEAVSEIVSIDLKREEEGLIALAGRLNADFHTYSAEQIRLCIEENDIFGGSEFVRKITGVPAVAEPSAHLASGGHLIARRYAKNGVTIAAGYRYSAGKSL